SWTSRSSPGRLSSWSVVAPTSPSPAEAHLRAADTVLARLIAAYGACTLTPEPDLFAALAESIISQQISVKAADAILRRVRAALACRRCLAPPSCTPWPRPGARTAPLPPGISGAASRTVLSAEC